MIIRLMQRSHNVAGCIMRNLIYSQSESRSLT